MRNVSDKSCRENQNTQFMLNNFFFLENRAFYETMWENITVPDRPQMTVWRTRILCRTAKVIPTHTYCFSTATKVTQTRLNITLFLHFLSCFVM